MEKVKKKKVEGSTCGGQISEVRYFDLYENEKQRGDMMA